MAQLLSHHKSLLVDNNTLYTQFERIPFPIIGYMDT